MEYDIQGVRKKGGELQTFVVRPDGSCGWNQIRGDKIILEKYHSEEQIELKLPESIQEVLKNHNAFSETEPIVVTQDMLNKITRSDHIDLSNAFFDEITFKGDFCKANFAHAKFSQFKMVDADFINCNFQNACISIESNACQFIHNNFSGAVMKHCTFTDTVFDSNNFEATTFRRTSFNRFSVLKDNSFLNSTFNAVQFGHIDVRGSNRYLDTISFTIDRAGVDEIAAMKNKCIQVLNATESNQLSDRKLQEIDWAKVDNIYEYEKAHGIPAKDRVTEWFGDYGMAVPKPGVSIIEFEGRWEEAKYNSPWNSPKTVEQAVEEIMQQAQMDAEMDMLMAE